LIDILGIFLLSCFFGDSKDNDSVERKKEGRKGRGTAFGKHKRNIDNVSFQPLIVPSTHNRKSKGIYELDESDCGGGEHVVEDKVMIIKFQSSSQCHPIKEE